MICVLRTIRGMSASVPISKFIDQSGMLLMNFEIKRDTSKHYASSVVYGFEVPVEPAAILEELQIHHASVKSPESDEIRGKETL